MKILTVIGARPQFIKAASVSRILTSYDEVIEVMVHTGQHYDSNMSDIFFEQMGIPKPNYHLGVGGGPHGAMTGRQLEKIEEVLIAERPDWLLVYGDTNSTLAGALAAAKLHIPVAHVEAGLRSFNRRMPEEVNRVLTDHISTLLFAPSEIARANLLKEGIENDRIHVVGDVMYDSALYYKASARTPSWFSELGIQPNEFVLCTIHRAENTDDLTRMRDILIGLANSALPIILPLHPRTRNTLREMNLSTPSNVHIVEPVGYLEMVWLEANCKLIATDSGGIQKEAYFQRKFCVTLRDETEWVELVEGGFNQLVGSDPKLIAKALTDRRELNYDNLIYGDGHSSIKIAQFLLNTK